MPSLDLNFCRSLKHLLNTLIDLRENRDILNIDMNEVGVSNAGHRPYFFPRKIG